MASRTSRDNVVNIARSPKASRRAQPKLAARGVLLEALVEAFGEGVYTTALDGSVLTWNRAAAQMTGLAAAEVIGRSHTLFRSADEVQRIERVIEALAAGAARIDLFGSIRRRDGSNLDVESTFSAIRDAAGQMLAIGVITRSAASAHAAAALPAAGGAAPDAESGQMQEARRAVRRFESMLEMSSVAFVERDTVTHRLTRVSPAFCRLSGYSEAQLLSMTIDDLISGSDRALLADRRARLLAGELRESTLMQMLQRADRTQCAVVSNITLLRGEDGDPDRFCTVYLDATELTAARADLAASEERYRRLADTMPDAVAILSTSGDTLFVNRALIDLLGYPALHWFNGGQYAVAAALDADGVERHRMRWAHFEQAGEFDETPYELAWLRGDGSLVTLATQVANLRDDDGRVTGLLVVQRDITAERLARIDRERVAAIVEASEDAIFSVSLDGVIESWNSGCTRLFGLRSRLAIGRRLDRIFPEAPTRALATMIGQVNAGETVRNAGWPAEETAAAHWVVSMRPVQGDEARASSIAVIVRDVSLERTATAALERERSFIRSVLDTLPQSVSVRDTLGRVVLANRRFDELHARDGVSTVGSTYSERVPDAAEADLLMRTDLEVLRTGKPVTYERRDRQPSGEQIDLQTVKVPIDVGGDIQILSVSTDITARRQAEHSLRTEREFIRTVIDTDPTLIYVRDAQGRFLLANRALATAIGRPIEDIEGHRLHDLAPDSPGGADSAASDAEVFRLRRAITRDECFRDASGADKWFSSTRLPLPGADGHPVVLCVSADVTETRRQALRIHELTNFDPLTGLPNRLLIEDRLQMALSAAEHEGRKVAVMFVDLDHFKTVNDSLGHPVGDRMLVAVATRMRSVLRDTDSIGRLGGDEFLIVLPDIESPDTAGLVAQKLLNALDEPFDVKGHRLNVNATAGIAVFPEDGTTPHLLMQNSDTAMYFAKEQGRAGYRFFTSALNARAARSLAIEHGIRRALRDGGFELWYQPVYSLHDRSVASMEALIRWRRTTGDVWGPSEFIGLAEERGLIQALGRWVLEAACTFLAERRAQGLPAIAVAINLSPIQIRQPGLVDMIRETLERHSLPASSLEVEVTESSIMHDIPAAIEVLQGLRSLGLKVAVDDFGTGHSSLAWLRQLPIDKLKIDRAFVANVPGHEVDIAIFAAIVQMAHALGIRTVAEGVENEAQLAHVRIAGCDLVQGNLLASPTPGPAVWELVDRAAGEANG